MYIQTLDIGLVLWKLVEEGLSFTEVVFVSPVGQPAIYVGGVESVLKTHAFKRWRERTMVLQAVPKVFYHLKKYLML